MISEYLDRQKIGSHCASTAIMNACAYYGLNMSESMCFGLGQALGFSFYKNENMNMYSFSGRSRDIIRNFFNVMGFNVEIRSNSNNNELLENLNYNINVCGIPILAKLDINELPYLVANLRLTRPIELSEHMAVIIGMDDKNFAISEYYTKKPIIVERSILLNAMNKKSESKGCNNLYYIIKNVPDKIDIHFCIRYAIYMNAHQLLYGFGTNLGMPGLKKFYHDLLVIKERYDKEAKKEIYLYADLSFEKIGTGGGNFRRMYARFLLEASRTLEDDNLIRIADIYTQLTILWKKLCKIFEIYVEQDIENDGVLNEIMDQIVTLETNGANKLFDYAKLK